MATKYHAAQVDFVFESAEIDPGADGWLLPSAAAFADLLQRDLYDDAGMSGAFEVRSCRQLPGEWDGNVPVRSGLPEIETFDDAFAMQQHLREAGFAVALFTPAEMGHADRDTVEEAMVMAGWREIEQGKE